MHPASWLNLGERGGASGVYLRRDLWDGASFRYLRVHIVTKSRKLMITIISNQVMISIALNAMRRYISGKLIGY